MCKDIVSDSKTNYLTMSETQNLLFLRHQNSFQNIQCIISYSFTLRISFRNNRCFFLVLEDIKSPFKIPEIYTYIQKHKYAHTHSHKHSLSYTHMVYSGVPTIHSNETTQITKLLFDKCARIFLRVLLQVKAT